MPSSEHTNITFIFEMFSEHNKVIVKPDRNTIVLHGARNIKTYEEMDPRDISKEYGWECVEFYPLSTPDQVIEASRKLDPSKKEGYVVRDQKFNRWKVKSPQYVALAHLNTNDSKSKLIISFRELTLYLAVNERHMLQIVRNNEGTEFLAHFPLYKPLYNKVRSSYDAFVKTVQMALAGQIDTQQLDRRLSDLIKQMHKKEMDDVRAFVQDYELDLLLKLMNLQIDEKKSKSKNRRGE